MSHAIRRQPAFDDPAAVLELVRRSGPFVPLARDGRPGTFVPPWFRRDLVTHRVAHVAGAELILDNPHYVEAAGRVYDGATLVEPTTVYVNVMGPAPYPFVAHTDIPVFHRASRRNCPVWLLGRMLASRLFEDERVRLATAVSWIFAGPGGSFHYWPDGPDGAPQVIDPPFENVAVVADNEAVYHGVGPLGATGAPTPTELTIGAYCDHDAGSGHWTIHDPDPVLAYDPADVRITISWKAEVFTDEHERDLVRAAAEETELPLDRIVATFMDDLRARRLDPTEPNDPLTDETWQATLNDAYPSRAPTLRVD